MMPTYEELRAEQRTVEAEIVEIKRRLYERAMSLARQDERARLSRLKARAADIRTELTKRKQG